MHNTFRSTKKKQQRNVNEIKTATLTAYHTLPINELVVKLETLLNARQKHK